MSNVVPISTITPTTSTEWSPEMLAEINQRFQEQSPEALLHWSLETFGPDIALGTGFGPSGIVLIHMVTQIRPETTIFYIDTEVLFTKTYALRDELEIRFGIQFTRVHSDLSLDDQAGAYGSRLWVRNPDLCCQIRKVIPLRRFLADQHAWITGLRRDQAPTRAHTQLVEWNATNQVVKLNPLAYWNEKQIWNYIEQYDLPFNPLHEQGYPSIGCVPCTRAVAPGEDLRAGRWSGQAKLECGIHIENGKVQRLNGTASPRPKGMGK